MLNTRWVKLFRDIWMTRGRMLMMVIAVSISLFGFCAILISYSILTREINLNYQLTMPASATLELTANSDLLKNSGDFISKVLAYPGIQNAEARASVLARIQTRSGVWQTLLLFVIKDFNNMKMVVFKPESGAWPPPLGTILLERAALPVLDVKQGSRVIIKTRCLRLRESGRNFFLKHHFHFTF